MAESGYFPSLFVHVLHYLGYNCEGVYLLEKRVDFNKAYAL
jgi:hypothetical protein